jgi:hypothetical protein
LIVTQNFSFYVFCTNTTPIKLRYACQVKVTRVFKITDNPLICFVNKRARNANFFFYLYKNLFGLFVIAQKYWLHIYANIYLIIFIGFFCVDLWIDHRYESSHSYSNMLIFFIIGFDESLHNDLRRMDWDLLVNKKTTLIKWP